MEETVGLSPIKSRWHVMLIAAIVQGWALYGLHHAITSHHWPATDQAWLMGLYGLVLFGPLTIQLTAQYTDQLACWGIAGAVSILFFYFGWHHGGAVYDATRESFANSGEFFPLGLISVVLWLLFLPFAQNRLSTGQWTIRYYVLFSAAWRNKLVLAEAALFTGVFWLLLALWQTLFHMLSVDYFRDLFSEPIFVYPITSLTFGCALHLIGAVERFTQVVLEQILNVLKWLAVVAGLILVLFTIALVFRLPSLVTSGERTIGAAWLLWLVAVIVLLLNAAYRDGSVANPYPKWIAQALRWAVPFTLIVSATALYALIIRTQHYGLTVERFWALVVAGTALAYSIGYSISTFGRGGWLAGIARVNVVVALGLIAVISAALTPLLSPYRLAASSQFRLAQEPTKEDDKEETNSKSPFNYLRFEAGRYGRLRLEELAKLKGPGNAEHIRKLAKAAIDRKQRWGNEPPVEINEYLDRVVIYPTNRTMDLALKSRIAEDWGGKENVLVYTFSSSKPKAGIYIDLNGDGIDDFALMTSTGGVAYAKVQGDWKLAGILNARSSKDPSDLLSDLAHDKVSAVVPQWKDLSIGAHKFKVSSTRGNESFITEP